MAFSQGPAFSAGDGRLWEATLLAGGTAQGRRRRQPRSRAQVTGPSDAAAAPQGSASCQRPTAVGGRDEQELCPVFHDMSSPDFKGIFSSFDFSLGNSYLPVFGGQPATSSKTARAASCSVGRSRRWLITPSDILRLHAQFFLAELSQDPRKVDACSWVASAIRLQRRAETCSG